MSYENKDRELNLKALCYSVVRKWRQMLAAALVLAVALGAFQGWKSLSVVMDPQSLTELQAAYEAAYADYQGQADALNTKITMAQEGIRQHGVYLQESVLMQIDYRNAWQAVVSLYIQTEENDCVSGAGEGYTRADMIADAYRLAMTDNRILEQAAATVGIKTQYLKELISIPYELYDERQEGPLVTVLIRSADAKSAQQFVDALIACLEQLREEIRQSMGDHTAKVVNNSITCTVDEELADLQEDASDRLVDYTDMLEEYRYGLTQLSAPAMPDLSVSSAVKSVIKYALVGFLAGAFLVAVWYGAAYAVGDKVYSAEELKSRFGIVLLGKASVKDRKRCFIDRWLDRAEVRGKTEAQGALAVIGANVSNHCPEGTVLLVAGSAGESYVEKIAQTLTQAMPGRTVVCGGSLLESLDAIEGLRGCDSVLLVERCGVSRYTQVKAQLDAVASVRKPLIGCVVLEK